RLFGEKVATKRYDWRPIEVRREGEIKGIAVSTSTVLISGKRAGLLAVTFHNTTSKAKGVPVQLNITGDTMQNDARPGLEYIKSWGFARPDTKKAKTSIAVEGQQIILHNGAGAIVVASDLDNLTWQERSTWSSVWVTTM